MGNGKRGGGIIFILLCTVVAGCATPRNAEPLPSHDSPSVELTPFTVAETDGFFGHAQYDDDLVREIEILRERADRNTGSPGVWKTKIFILRNIDFKDNSSGTPMRYSATMSVAETRSTRRAAERLQDWVWVLSGGNCRMDADVIVVDKTLTRLSRDGALLHPWTDVIDDVIGGYVEKGKVDSVIILWPAGNIPHANLVGLTLSSGYKGAGFSWVVRKHVGTDDATGAETALTEVALHEWLHQVTYSLARLGYDSLPSLDAAGAMGYRDDHTFGVVHRGLITYYRDFMSAYITPDMWRRSSVTYNGPLKLSPRFDGGWISEWLIAGGLPNDGAGLDLSFIDEENVVPDGWKKVETDSVLSFYGRFDTSTNAVAYAHVYVYSPTGRDAKLWAGSDDGIAVWVNGARVWRNKVVRCIWPDEDEIPIHLKKGWNRMLFKVDQYAGGWSLLARLSDLENLPLNDTIFRAAPPEDRSEIVLADTEPRPAEPPWTPKHFRWSDVRNDPWRLLPELTEERLRLITGDPALKVTTDNGATALVPGPGKNMSLTRLAPNPGGRRVDNALDFRPDTLESIAWLRYERDGERRDLLLLRADLVEFWLGRLDATEDASTRVIGRITAGDRPIVVVDTKVAWPDADGPPPSEVHLRRERTERYR